MKQIPEIKPGDLIKVYIKIIEGNKERITPFQGIVTQVKGSTVSKTFTVRKISAGIGIERIFPLHSPLITKIEVKKTGKVRRAKLSYLSHKRERKMKIKDVASKELVVEEMNEKSPTQETPHTNKETKTSEEKFVEGTPGAKTVEKV